MYTLRQTLQVTTMLVGSILSLANAASIVAPRAPAEPALGLTPLTAKAFPEYGARRVMIRYGPYDVPPFTENNGMSKHTERTAQKPCSDCLITYAEANLHYEDGSTANADTGLWLHHTVTSNLARKNLGCPNWRDGDHFFASGNERTVLNFSIHGLETVGYYVAPTDNFAVRSELMNMQAEPQRAYLTYIYEFIPGVPAGFEKASPLIVDVAGCSGNSEVSLRSTAGSFDYSSQAWISYSYYRIIANWGHLHDGGVHLVTKKNGKRICDIKAKYGETSAYISRDMHTGEERTHISSIGACLKDQGYLVPGDRLTTKAFYNTTLHEPMQGHDGAPEPVMGLAQLFVVEDTMSLTTRLKDGALTLAKQANNNRSILGSSFTFLVVFGLFAFWLGRRTKKVTTEEASYHLQSVRGHYQD